MHNYIAKVSVNHREIMSKSFETKSEALDWANYISEDIQSSMITIYTPTYPPVIKQQPDYRASSNY